MVSGQFTTWGLLTLCHRLIGNAEDNILNGMDGNDTLIGGGGHDTLTGGAGADTFMIDRIAHMVAAISDFTSGTDHIGLSQTSFGALAFNTSTFGSGSNMTAATTTAMRLFYNQTQGDLYYDADGSGVGVAVQIATFTSATKPALAASDFVLAG